MKRLLFCLIRWFSFSPLAFIQGFLALADVLIALMIAGFLFIHLGFVLQTALIVAAMSIALLIRAKRLWRQTYGTRKVTELSLSMALRVTLTLLLLISAGLVFTNLLTAFF